MNKVVIIEDEKPAARRLQRMLQKEGLTADVFLHSVSDGRTWFAQNPPPDLIFADIQLTDGLSFDIFEDIQVKSPIIFTTAYDQYAIKAFKLNSVDYLLKPIKQKDLQFALQKFNDSLLNTVDMSALLSQILQGQNYKQRFLVQYGMHLKSIEVNDIGYFYSADKSTFLVTLNDESFLIEQSLEKLEKQLNPKNFLRINRQMILSHRPIKDIIQYSNSRLKIILKNTPPFEIIVARERVKAFKNWLT